MNFVRSCSLIAAIIFGCNHAFASVSDGDTPQQHAREAAGEDQEKLDENTIKNEMQKFNTTKVTLADAAGIAVGRHAGSSTLDVTFDDEKGAPVYRVKTTKGQTVWETTVDALTGNVQNEVSYLIETMPKDDRVIISQRKSIKPSLLDAIAVAEGAAQGKALSGGLVKSDGQLRFVIVVSNGNDLKKVILDPPKKNASIR